MTEKTINILKVRVADSFEVSEKFDFDEDMEVFLKGEIVKKETKNNQDGSCDLIYHFKALDFEIKKVG